MTKSVAVKTEKKLVKAQKAKVATPTKKKAASITLTVKQANSIQASLNKFGKSYKFLSDKLNAFNA